jgi:hypothetical protein
MNSKLLCSRSVYLGLYVNDSILYVNSPKYSSRHLAGPCFGVSNLEKSTRLHPVICKHG